MTGTGCHPGLARVEDGRLLPEASVRLRSRGVVLVAGDDPSALDVAGSLPRELRAVVFAPGATGHLRDDPRVVGGRVTAVEGHLGAFRARALAAAGEADIGAFSFRDDGCFDLVLDLGAIPLVPRAVPPPGYIHAGPDPEARRRAGEALGALVGTFAKPRHVDFDAASCAHGASGLRGCGRCLCACDADAIRSAGEIIALDAALCQGCAACAIACPTGALSMRSPSREALLGRLVEATRQGRDRFGAFSVVLHGIGDATEVREAAASRPWVLVEVEPVAACGEESWAAALSLGSSRVVVIRDPTCSPRTAETVSRGLRSLSAMLDRADRLVCATAGELVALAEEPAAPPSTDEDPALEARTKPGLLEAALARVVPAPRSLPEGSSQGGVRVDRARCTLCSACANVCPTGALRQESADGVRLRFTEAGCVQCGLCAEACPETAVHLEPRWAGRAARAAAVTLAEDDPARCPACGSSFGSRRLVEAGLGRLGRAAGLGEESLARLRLCPGCRQESMFRES